MTYEDAVEKVEMAIAKQGLSTDVFWKMVHMAEWPDQNYDESKLMYLKTMDKLYMIRTRRVIDKIWGIVDEFIGDRNPAGGGDDSHSDFIYHIIGMGREELYLSLKDYSRMEARGNLGEYKESFGYAVPYVSDWDNPEEAIADLERSIKRKAESKSGVKHVYFHHIMANIQDVLESMEGKEIASIHNKLCNEQIEYMEDSTWKVKVSETA